MPIRASLIRKLDSTADKLCALDMSRPRYNLSGLGVHHKFEPDALPSFIVRDAEPQEAKLVAPGTKGVYEDMLSRIGVQHANLGVEGDKELDVQAFEEFYNKTVDLADLCQLADVNERLNQVANSYQGFTLRKEELAGELKKLAVVPRIKQRLAKIPQMEKELDDAVAQRQEMEQQTEVQTAGLESIEKDISYLRMEVSISQQSEEQAMTQLKAKRKELEQLRAELSNKRRMLETRKEMYRKKRPLTAVEHSERMVNELRVALVGVKDDDASLHDVRDAYISKLTEIISNSDAVDVTNGYLDQVFANTIDSVANEDVESLDARRA
ncbi:hypothetical protein FBU59_003378, partial [Linderina macrospora]